MEDNELIPHVRPGSFHLPKNMSKFFSSNCQYLAQSTSLKTSILSKPPRLLPLLSKLHSSSNVSELNYLVDQPQQERTQNDRGKDDASWPRVSHPWPEWGELMELVMKKGYFEVDENGSPSENVLTGPKSSNLVRTAFLNFGRDRFGLIRHLSRQDIKVIVGAGCPDTDRKVVNSGKRLRAHVGINESNVCGACQLRGSCERAYLNRPEEERARTVDVMRILLTFSHDFASSSVDNRQYQDEHVEKSARGLIRQIVGFCHEERDPADLREGDSVGDIRTRKLEYGQTKAPMQQGDWSCPSCNFLNFAKNIKCLRCNWLFEDKARKFTEGHDQLPLKKGDWRCTRCSFLNFAKNSKCLLCQENPPKRQLGPGEWECDSCRYINFRNNCACLRCDYKRPKASNSSHQSGEPTGRNIDYHRMGAPSGEVKMEQETNLNRWRFVEENNENQAQFRIKDDPIDFMNFPILGGRSMLSRSKEEIEEWKSKMRKGGRSLVWNDEKERGSGVSVGRECSVDEEMEEWFR